MNREHQLKFQLGPDLGAHTNEVLKDILGLSNQEIANLNENGITSLNNKDK